MTNGLTQPKFRVNKDQKVILSFRSYFTPRFIFFISDSSKTFLEPLTFITSGVTKITSGVSYDENGQGKYWNIFRSQTTPILRTLVSDIDSPMPYEWEITA